MVEANSDFSRDMDHFEEIKILGVKSYLTIIGYCFKHIKEENPKIREKLISKISPFTFSKRTNSYTNATHATFTNSIVILFLPLITPKHIY